MTSEKAIHTRQLWDVEREALCSRGYAIVRGQFSSLEVSRWRAECDRLWKQPGIVEENNPRIMCRQTIKGNPVPDRIEPVIDISPLIRELAQDERVTALARGLLGGDVTLFKDKVIYKHPGVMGYSLHRDFPYWEPLGLPVEAYVIMQFSVDPATRKNGAVEFFPRLHHRLLPGHPREPRDIDETKLDLSGGELAVTNSGDVLIFDARIPHRSGTLFTRP